MKILEVKSLEIPDIKVLKFARFMDDRGYFTEQFRRSDMLNSGIDSLKNVEFVQGNQSYSNANVIRGMHFQWNPYMGKLVRTLSGHMTDLVLDIRKGSPTFGKMLGYEMPASDKLDYDEWIWVPPGFAHGNFFIQPSRIEYLCTGEYAGKDFEAGISPLSKDIDWSLCDTGIRNNFLHVVKNQIITDKDKNGLSLENWIKDPRSDNFIYSQLKEANLC